jgi:hypothetical protein
MHWSSQQELRLIELYEDERHLIDGTNNSSDANRKRKQAWQRIAMTLNLESGSKLDHNDVRKKFQNMCTGMRSKLAQNRQSIQKTGGGEGSQQPLSLPEERLYSLLGGTKAFTGERFFIESGADSLKNQDQMDVMAQSLQGPSSSLDMTSSSSMLSAELESEPFLEPVKPVTKGTSSKSLTMQTVTSLGASSSKRKASPEKIKKKRAHGSGDLAGLQQKVLELELKVLQNKLELQEFERTVMKMKMEVLQKIDVLAENFILQNPDKFSVLDI